MSGIKSAYGYPERAIHPERKKKEKEKNEGKMEEKKGGREKNKTKHGTSWNIHAWGKTAS